jgi:hypothetical protein
MKDVDALIIPVGLDGVWGAFSVSKRPLSVKLPGVFLLGYDQLRQTNVIRLPFEVRQAVQNSWLKPGNFERAHKLLHRAFLAPHENTLPPAMAT